MVLGKMRVRKEESKGVMTKGMTKWIMEKIKGMMRINTKE